MAKTGNKGLKYSLIAIGAVIVIFIIIVIAKSPTTQNLNASDSLAPTSLVNQIASLDTAKIQTIGTGTATAFPQAINGTPISQNGKPEVLFMGSEYCPYCAAERWSLTTALTRFGTFSGLRVTHSSSTDVYPDTQTLSFHGSTYTSNYLVFTPVEMYSNIPQGNGYTTLQTPTSQQQSLMNTYDAPPYVPSSDAGAIPFIYFGGKYLITGASYSPAVLQGKTAQEITDALSDPNNAITKAIGGSTNAITAAICGMTNNQPSNVCTPTIQAIEKTFK